VTLKVDMIDHRLDDDCPMPQMMPKQTKINNKNMKDEDEDESFKHQLEMDIDREIDKMKGPQKQQQGNTVISVQLLKRRITGQKINAFSFMMKSAKEAASPSKAEPVESN
jgi:hypothetical protein